MALKRVGILTGGGDCSGLNAVIRGRDPDGHHPVRGRGGGPGGWLRRSCLQPDHATDHQKHQGHPDPGRGRSSGPPTMGNPFAYREFDDRGEIAVRDLSAQAMETFRSLELDCLFVVGGRGHPGAGIQVPADGHARGRHPQDHRQRPFRARTTPSAFRPPCRWPATPWTGCTPRGRSHDRVMILEVMGRNAGWIALEAGLAGGAHIILIPEIPYNLDNVVTKIRHRIRGKSPFSIIMVAEGAREEGGERITQGTAGTRLQGVEQLGGIGFHLANQIRERIPLEVRTTVLGHIQRGGSLPRPSTGCWAHGWARRAVDAAARGDFGTMVALKTPDIVLVPLSELAGLCRTRAHGPSAHPRGRGHGRESGARGYVARRRRQGGYHDRTDGPARTLRCGTHSLRLEPYRHLPHGLRLRGRALRPLHAAPRRAGRARGPAPPCPSSVALGSSSSAPSSRSIRCCSTGTSWARFTRWTSPPVITPRPPWPSTPWWVSWVSCCVCISFSACSEGVS